MSRSVSVVTLQLSCCRVKAAINNINEWGQQSSVKLNLQEEAAGQIWPVGCTLWIFALDYFITVFGLFPLSYQILIVFYCCHICRDYRWYLRNEERSVWSKMITYHFYSTETGLKMFHLCLPISFIAYNQLLCLHFFPVITILWPSPCLKDYVVVGRKQTCFCFWRRSVSAASLKMCPCEQICR